MNTETPLFAEQFEAAKALLPAGDAPWRQAAFDSFSKAGLPDRKREAWRYTPLSTLATANYAPVTAGEISSDEIARHFVDGAIHLVFVNGLFSPELSGEAADFGFSRLADALAGGKSLPVYSNSPDDTLVGLNGAFVTDGAVLAIESGCQIKAPIQLVFVGTQQGMIHCRNIIDLGADAHAKVIETYVGDTPHWTNIVNQLTLGRNARLEHIRVMIQGSDCQHIARTDVQLEEASVYDSFALSLGGSLSRHELRANIVGAGADCRLSGVSLGRGKDIRDIVTLVNHAVPECTSTQLFKSVLDGQAKSIFQGKVIVQKGAHHTDARQSCKSILLSREASANTKPELEIFNDDVQCAHGATVGELDEDQLFYLMARGLPEAGARQLLVEGFIADVLEQIGDDTLRQHLAGVLANWFKEGATT